jgi:hypothetical protein
MQNSCKFINCGEVEVCNYWFKKSYLRKALAVKLYAVVTNVFLHYIHEYSTFEICSPTTFPNTKMDKLQLTCQNTDAGLVLSQAICKTIKKRCELCTEHAGSLDFRFLLSCRGHLRCSGILRNAERSFCSDVSRQHIGPTFKGQGVQVSDFWTLEDGVLVFLTLEDGTDRLSRNVGTELSVNAAEYSRNAQMSCRISFRPNFCSFSK